MIAWALAVGMAWAQARPLSVEEALRITEAASEDVAVATAGVTRATGAVWSARSGFLPSLAASTSWQHTFASEWDDVFPDTGGAIDVPFGKPDSWRVDLTASQLVFAGGRVHAQARMASSGLEVARLSVDSTRAAAVLTTAEAYYDAVLAERLVEIALATLARAETTLEHARLGNEVGRTAEFEVVRAAAEVETQRVAVIRQRRLRDTTMLRLAQLVEIDGDLELTSPLETDIAPLAAEVAGVAPVAEPTDRIAYRIGSESVRLAKAGLAVARAPWFPQVSLSGSVGWVSYPDGVLPPTSGEAWKDNVGVGLTISVPIFSGGRIWGGLLDARGAMFEAETRLHQTGELVELDAVDARAGLESAEAQWEATGATLAAAERAYAIAEVRFAEGVSTQTELVDARLLEQQAQVSRAQAARDLQIARIRIALLGALPIAPGY